MSIGFDSVLLSFFLSMLWCVYGLCLGSVLESLNSNIHGNDIQRGQ